jgi:hypothetical protein
MNDQHCFYSFFYLDKTDGKDRSSWGILFDIQRERENVLHGSGALLCLNDF